MTKCTCGFETKKCPNCGRSTEKESALSKVVIYPRRIEFLNDEIPQTETVKVTVQGAELRSTRQTQPAPYGIPEGKTITTAELICDVILVAPGEY